MIQSTRQLARQLLGFWLLLLLAAPVHAQLDPRLRAGLTDFLDMYQQSASVKSKPEIVTLFDNSGSMATMMFHPLYQNLDATDVDDYRRMSFQLHQAVPGTMGNNTYKVIATTTSGKCTATSTYVVTVGASGVAKVTTSTNPGCPKVTGGDGPAPTAPTITASAFNAKATATFNCTPQSPSASSGSDKTKYNISTTCNAGAQPNPNTGLDDTYEITSVTVNPSYGPYAAGTTVTLTAYMTHNLRIFETAGEPASHALITWAGGVTAGATTLVSAGKYVSTATWTVPTYKFSTKAPSAGTPNELWAITGKGTLSAGNTLTLNTYFKTQLAAADNLITWSVTGSNNCSTLVATPQGTSGATTTANTTSGGNATWVIPAYCATPNQNGTNAYVTATLDASAGANYIANIAYVGPLTSNLLIKPDGTLVTAADAKNVSASAGLYGVAALDSDVRNWIRAASHVRFSVNNKRTIDIPIPWSITDGSSTGSPLSSQTTYDQQLKVGVGTDGAVTTTTYGSGINMEMDSSYRVENAAYGTFSSDPDYGGALSDSATSFVYLYSAAYRPSYISWLFNGKYQNQPTLPNYTSSSDLIGKYIVCDAVTSDSTYLAAGQTVTKWGQGYGPQGLWGNVTLPNYLLDGTLNPSAPTQTVDASFLRIPALTRLQACKKAAIQTWIKHQADVFWAFRYLDVSHEATTNGSTSKYTIDNNSRPASGTVIQDATSQHVNGSDSYWTVLNNSATQGITSTSGASVTGMKRIASVFASGGTPLTFALARTLAQYTDPKSVFNDVVGSDVSQCANSFLILFTDGIDNNGNDAPNPKTATPYVTINKNGDSIFNALLGNEKIINSPSSVNCRQDWWNLFTFAGIGAHLADPAHGTLGTDFLAPITGQTSWTSGTPSAFLPLAISSRNGVPYTTPHRVTTMTVGVSLGGQYTDASSPKRSLFLAAVLGDPASIGGSDVNINTFHSFIGSADGKNDWIKDPQDPTSFPVYGVKKPGAVYFFDATDPDKLSSSLDYALRLAISTAGNNSTSSPNLPYIGASFGQQVYIGKFQTPKSGGVIWPGDLLMFGTREINGTISILDSHGTVANVLDQTTAQWSASTALFNNRYWYGRQLYTRLPGTATVPERGLKTFTDIGTEYRAADTADNKAGLMNYVAVANQGVGSASQQQTIQDAAGGNIHWTLDKDNRPISNRSNIMGDIINSSPVAQEYKFTDSTISSGISASGSKLSGLTGANRFRMLLVGTNQGWLHAFGEVSAVGKTAPDAAGVTQEMIVGKVDELWSFMPTDFLANLDYAYGPTSGYQPHRFMVDGTPSIYFLDLPPAAGGPGNGVLDYGSTPEKSERGIAIIGLGKGGRSYYALNVRDPFHPTLQWSLVPDEASLFPEARNLSSMSWADVKTLIGNMGFSTCTPGIGRVAFTHGGETRMRDVVFLGGGSSNSEIEKNFPIYSTPLPKGQSTPLGRSVLALDVNTGELLGAVSLTASAGPVGTGVIPLEFILNSGMAQRAYFLDRTGGLWSWGSKATVAATAATGSSPLDYRVDSSDLAKWTSDGTLTGTPGIRKVYQDGTGNSAIYTTLPAPFRVGSFPGKGKDKASVPAVVGIAMVSGDRNNPLDWKYTLASPATSTTPATLNTYPKKFRLTVVFDRQDSRVWKLDAADGSDTGILEANLIDFTGTKVAANAAKPCADPVWKNITPGCDDFYLAPSTGTPYFGYRADFLPAAKGTFFNKGINAPMVVSGTLFYTFFEPTKADPCTGGTGISHSMVIADVLLPVLSDTRTVSAKTSKSTPSGEFTAWTGVASNYVAFGTRGVFQGGTVDATPVGGTAATAMVMKTILGKSTSRHPKARVWRTVQ